jgi:methyl acetate hydrolase
MKKETFFLTLIVALFLLSCNNSANLNRRIKEGKYSLSQIQEINKVFDSISKNTILPSFIVASVTKDTIVYLYTKGNEVWTKQKPVNLNSIFRIYSMTKAITAVAAMQLVEQGKVKLDEPLDKWLPDMMDIPVLQDNGKLKKSHNSITLRQLLTHTSGFAYIFTSNKLAKFKKPKDWPYKDDPRLFEPGKQFMYGTSYDWAGRLVERISGMNLEMYIKENIAGPLGMYHTFFAVPDSLISHIVSFGKLVNGRIVSDTAHQMDKEEIKPTEFSGGGGLFSTVHDYTQFLKCILNDGTLNSRKILKSATLDTMCQNQIGDLWVKQEIVKSFSWLGDSTNKQIGIDKWGLAWAIDMKGRDGVRSVGTLHWAGAANTFFSIDRKKGKAVTFFSNFFPYGHNSAESIFFKAEEELYK